LNPDVNQLFKRKDLSPGQLDEIESRSNSIQKQYEDVSAGHSMFFFLRLCFIT